MAKKRYVTEDEYEDIEEYNRNASKKARKGCLIVFLVLLIAVVIAGLIVYSSIKKEMDGENATAISSVTLTVPSGSGGTTIGTLLEDNGLIGSANTFRLYVRFVNNTADFKAGTFVLTPGMSYEEIIAALSGVGSDTRPTKQIQILEGKSVMHIASLFEEAGLCTAEDFLAEADNLDAFSDITFIQKLQENIDPNVFHLSEGYLFPDTYSFYTDDTPHNIVRKLYEQMDSKITPEMYAKMEELNLSLRETITLASLIQAEAGHVDQQPKVSGVFWNRLGGNWSRGTLGSDVTLRYVKIWMQWNLPEFANKTYREISYDEARAAVGEDLFYAYVTDDSDTKSRAGLPAGPICSVSLTAIEAALNPEQHNYYYFLTDFYENYYYAETYDEHLANISIMNQKNEEYAAEQANSAANAG
ncbi:endolytic transglycosylase MltG [Ruminococcaceae bacterium OttesenSCG-928-A16]|nr:endolytic transglycosylase MltG [Ruminococcaceae bacterium OttesenSCG-928-A16]